MSDMETQRRTSRRRMAQIAFGLMVLKAVLVTMMLLFSEDRLEIAQAFTAATPATVSIMTVFTLIILAYLGISAGEYNQRLKHAKEEQDDAK